jgi:hypothetical protein
MNKDLTQIPTIVIPAPDRPPHESQVFGGSRFEAFNNAILKQAVSTLIADGTKRDQESKMNACVQGLIGIAPKDELEGMLATQMLVIHNAAMECFRRAAIENQTPHGRYQNLNFANKLSRSYALHMETLNKHRGNGQQKVTVEHVHVHQGGQAIVGNVTTGGLPQNLKDQTHAHFTKPACDSQE